MKNIIKEKQIDVKLFSKDVPNMNKQETAHFVKLLIKGLKEIESTFQLAMKDNNSQLLRSLKHKMKTMFHLLNEQMLLDVLDEAIELMERNPNNIRTQLIDLQEEIESRCRILIAGLEDY
ncbi:hypothetical protein [Algivirga pacifica]|uniref:HPt domain-containing protein n=1 Tax=Algivirga pacifica TaxID=1162670 RepID=A0ABP9D0Q1_9BACT